MKNKWIEKDNVMLGSDCHFASIPFGLGCTCTHPHSIVMGIGAESHAPYEFVMRFPDGSEIRRLLTHKEWVQLYLGCSTSRYMPRTEEELEEKLFEMGCQCRDVLAKPEGIN